MKGLNRYTKLKPKNKWEKLFSPGSIRRAQEAQMRPQEELDEIVEKIRKTGKI